jgi:hypothetical protein
VPGLGRNDVQYWALAPQREGLCWAKLRTSSPQCAFKPSRRRDIFIPFPLLASLFNMASPALPGLFFCFVACVLLVIVTVSSPIWDAVSFLDASVGGREVHFGVFGYTGSARKLGYTIDPSVLGVKYVPVFVLSTLYSPRL